MTVSTLKEWNEHVGHVGIPKTEFQCLLQTYEQWINENPNGYECDDEQGYPALDYQQ